MGELVRHFRCPHDMSIASGNGHNISIFSVNIWKYLVSVILVVSLSVGQFSTSIIWAPTGMRIWGFSMCSKTENQHSHFKGNLKDAPQEHAWPTRYKCSLGAWMTKLNWCMRTLHYDPVILTFVGLKRSFRDCYETIGASSFIYPDFRSECKWYCKECNGSALSSIVCSSLPASGWTMV